MSLNTRAFAGYLMTMGLDKNASNSLAARFADDSSDSSMSFDSLIFEYKPIVGKKEAMHIAATSCLGVIGSSEYPLDQVQGLVACLSKKFNSIDSLLQCVYFESKPMSDLLGAEGVSEILNTQFYKSKNHRGGILGLFS